MSVPFSLQAEEAVVASLLLDPEALGRVMSNLLAGDFMDIPCRLAFDACVLTAKRGEMVNQLTVAHQLSRSRLGQNGDGRTQLDEIGGPSFLSRIVAELPTPIGVEHYADIVHRDGVYRQLIGASKQIEQMAAQGGPGRRREDRGSGCRRIGRRLLGLHRPGTRT